MNLRKRPKSAGEGSFQNRVASGEKRRMTPNLKRANARVLCGRLAIRFGTEIDARSGGESSFEIAL